MRITHLKIKIKTLADEAHHIRREERKALKHARYQAKHAIDKGNAPDGLDGGYNPEYETLHSHRVGTVRWAARNNLLAYGFLRGMPYSRVENKTSWPPLWRDVEKVARRFYDGNDFDGDWATWKDAADEHLAGYMLAA